MMITRWTHSTRALSLHTFGLSFPEWKVSETQPFMTLEEITLSLTDPKFVWMIAEDHEGGLLGACLASMADPDRAGACIVYLGVLPGVRRQGVATKLLSATLTELRGLGQNYIYTWAHPTSGVVELMETAGFVKGHTCVWMDSTIGPDHASS